MGVNLPLTLMGDYR